ncbi:hypothetical protein ACTXT7_017222 [Hymenolepis weldensis]
MFQYGRDVAGRKRKKRKQYLFAEEYEWDTIPTSTALEEAQHEIDAQVHSLQGLGFDLAQSTYIPAAAQIAIMKGIAEAGALLHSVPTWKPKKLMLGNLLKASITFLFLLGIWMDDSYSKGKVNKSNNAAYLDLDKYTIDVYKYESLLNGVNWDNLLLEQLKERDIRSFDEIFKFFTVEEITDFNSTIGVQWREIAKQQLQSPNNKRLETELTNGYLENLKNLRHECQVVCERDVEIGSNWLMMMLNHNGIDIGELLKDIVNIMDKRTKKVNTLCFKGQTNTGKKLLANLITSHLTLGTVCRRGDQTAFHFDNLLNRSVALMEEPRITMTTKNDYKCLLGGDRFEIDVKYGARRFLPRIPVIGTTNEDLGALLTSIDQVFKRYGFYGDTVQNIEVPDNAEYLYQTPRRITAEEYDVDEDGLIIHVQPKN